MPLEKIFSHFREERKSAIEVIVGQEKIGPPQFQGSKNQGGNEQTVPQ